MLSVHSIQESERQFWKTIWKTVKILLLFSLVSGVFGLGWFLDGTPPLDEVGAGKALQYAFEGTGVLVFSGIALGKAFVNDLVVPVSQEVYQGHMVPAWSYIASLTPMQIFLATCGLMGFICIFGIGILMYECRKEVGGYLKACWKDLSQGGKWFWKNVVREYFFAPLDTALAPVIAVVGYIAAVAGYLVLVAIMGWVVHMAITNMGVSDHFRVLFAIAGMVMLGGYHVFKWNYLKKIDGLALGPNDSDIFPICDPLTAFVVESWGLAKTIFSPVVAILFWASVCFVPGWFAYELLIKVAEISDQMGAFISGFGFGAVMFYLLLKSKRFRNGILIAGNWVSGKVMAFARKTKDEFAYVQACAEAFWGDIAPILLWALWAFTSLAFHVAGVIAIGGAEGISLIDCLGWVFWIQASLLPAEVFLIYKAGCKFVQWWNREMSLIRLTAFAESIWHWGSVTVRVVYLVALLWSLVEVSTYSYMEFGQATFFANLDQLWVSALVVAPILVWGIFLAVRGVVWACKEYPWTVWLFALSLTATPILPDWSAFQATAAAFALWMLVKAMINRRIFGYAAYSAALGLIVLFSLASIPEELPNTGMMYSSGRLYSVEPEPDSKPEYGPVTPDQQLDNHVEEPVRVVEIEPEDDWMMSSSHKNPSAKLDDAVEKAISTGWFSVEPEPGNSITATMVLNTHVDLGKKEQTGQTQAAKKAKPPTAMEIIDWGRAGFLKWLAENSEKGKFDTSSKIVAAGATRPVVYNGITCTPPSESKASPGQNSGVVDSSMNMELPAIQQVVVQKPIEPSRKLYPAGHSWEVPTTPYGGPDFIEVGFAIFFLGLVVSGRFPQVKREEMGQRDESGHAGEITVKRPQSNIITLRETGNTAEQPTIPTVIVPEDLFGSFEHCSGAKKQHKGIKSSSLEDVIKMQSTERKMLGMRDIMGRSTATRAHDGTALHAPIAQGSLSSDSSANELLQAVQFCGYPLWLGRPSSERPEQKGNLSGRETLFFDWIEVSEGDEEQEAVGFVELTPTTCSCTCSCGDSPLVRAIAKALEDGNLTFINNGEITFNPPKKRLRRIIAWAMGGALGLVFATMPENWVSKLKAFMFGLRFPG